MKKKTAPTTTTTVEMTPDSAVSSLKAQLGETRYRGLVAQAARFDFTEETLLEAAIGMATRRFPIGSVDEIDSNLLAKWWAHTALCVVLLAGSGPRQIDKAFVLAAAKSGEAYAALLGSEISEREKGNNDAVGGAPVAAGEAPALPVNS